MITDYSFDKEVYVDNLDISDYDYQLFFGQSDMLVI